MCEPGEFQCPDDQCVAAERVCDGHKDCPSGTDETACSSKGIYIEFLSIHQVNSKYLKQEFRRFSYTTGVEVK